jgi:pyruvate,water dikinase
MAVSGRTILWFRDCSKKSFPMVGGKNANLGEMVGAGIGVPPGFAVSSEAFRLYMEKEGLWDKVARSLDKVSVEDIHSIAEAGSAIRETILSTPIPENIEKEILIAYGSLCEQCEAPNLPVAVRSSATAEDLDDASFAGQQDSYLWIWGEKEVIDATRRCWASLYTDRAITYRIRAGFPQDKVLISVGIQKMVNARSAGVMFTVDPVTGDRSKVTIDANWGFGESIVQGMVSPDHFVVRKDSLEIKSSIIGQKSEKVVAKDCGTVVEPVSEKDQVIPCVSVAEVKEIAKLGIRIEEHYGAPQDIEWAIDGELPFPENILTTQARPVTAAGKKGFSKDVMKNGKKSDTDHLIDLMLKGFD